MSLRSPCRMSILRNAHVAMSNLRNGRVEFSGPDPYIGNCDRCMYFYCSKFKDTVLMSTDFVDRLTVRGDNVVAENNKVTIFAPIDSAFQNLENAGNIDLSQDEELRERVSKKEGRSIRTFNFGNISSFCKYVCYDTFTIPFQDVNMFIKGHLAQHQERSCIWNLSITFKIFFPNR